MLTWLKRRAAFKGMAIVYLLTAATIAFNLLESGRPAAGAWTGLWLLLAVTLVIVRLAPLYRLGVGLLAIGVLISASWHLRLPFLVIVATLSLYLIAFVVPTWVSPTLLGVGLLVETFRLSIPLREKSAAMGAIFVAGIIFGSLAEKHKLWERERRDLSSTSGELSHSLRQVEYLALHDPLTGLPNRRLLTQFLEDSLKNQRHHQGFVAVVYIDLDRFKAINDGAGHGFGDRVLKAVAQSISRSLQPGDVLSRQGGDEFILVLAPAKTRLLAQERIEALRAMLSDGLVLDGRRVFATASFGVAFYPHDGGDPEELLRYADLALYRAKDEGRNRVSLFNNALEREAAFSYHLDSGLHRAMSEKEFFLEYQPQVDILTGRTVGIEALIRWQSGQEGRVLPDAFLPEAQKAGLMEAIDIWVLESAIRDVSEVHWWRANAASLAVNVSVTSLESTEFIPRLLSLLKKHDLRAERLEMEITESIVSKNADVVVSRLADLRRHGIGVAIDDFGMGYSSLSYLKDFPCTRIKIDRAFVSDLSRSDSIPRAIVAVAKSLRLDLVAEGVETEDQAERLLEMGCDIAQGYYYQPSVPLKDIKLKYNPAPREDPA